MSQNCYVVKTLVYVQCEKYTLILFHIRICNTFSEHIIKKSTIMPSISPNSSKPPPKRSCPQLRCFGCEEVPINYHNQSSVPIIGREPIALSDQLSPSSPPQHVYRKQHPSSVDSTDSGVVVFDYAQSWVNVFASLNSSPEHSHNNR